MPMSYQFKSMNDLVDYLNQLERRINDLEVENSDLRAKITSIDSRSLDVIAFVKEHWPKTGMVSSSFWVRAITVYGHYFVIQLLISILLFILYLLVLAPIIAQALSTVLPKISTP
jgi:hypothetical protein